MRRERIRQMHFTVHRLHDGTVLSAFPIRKPSKQELKRDRVRIDPDGVAREFADNGKNLSNVENETRTRFQDIIATNLNTRRAIRQLVSPLLKESMDAMQKIRVQMDRIEALLMSERGSIPADNYSKT